MKRTTQDISELERFALDAGVSIEYEDGASFNAGGRASGMYMEPEEVDEGQRFDELIKKITEIVSRPVHVTVDAPAPVQTTAVQTTAVTAWTFEFERNQDGTIKRIHATSKG